MSTMEDDKDDINDGVRENGVVDDIDALVSMDSSLDSTLEGIKERKQKEREDKLADMMSHYHKKYSSPSLDSINTLANGDETPEKSGGGTPNHRRSQSLTKKKDELAEQMKRYNDQFGSIISSVNSILSSSSSSNSIASSLSNTNSPVNASPVLQSASLTADGDHSALQPLTPERNLLNESQPTTTTTTTTASTNNIVPPYQHIENTPPQLQQPNIQQQHDRFVTDFNKILYFEHENIPMLTNVGFQTLKSIEIDAMKCSESVMLLTKNLNYSLQMMTKMSVELFHAYKVSNESLCQSVGNSITETGIMINKCIELNEQTKSIHQLHSRIKFIKDYVNRLESVILNIIKQASTPINK